MGMSSKTILGLIALMAYPLVAFAQGPDAEYEVTQLGPAGEYTTRFGHRQELVEFWDLEPLRVGGRTRVPDEESAWDAWYWDGAKSRRVGLYGEGFLSEMGSFSSQLVGAARAGAVGTSVSYGDGWRGSAVWYDGGAGSVRIDPQEARYVRSDGQHFARVSSISDQGMVTGYSAVYDGMEQLGYEVWVHDLDTGRYRTVDTPAYGEIGEVRQRETRLRDTPGHEGLLGVHALSVSGEATVDHRVWYSDGSGSRYIGLEGAEYRNRNGLRYEDASRHDSGIIAGRSWIFEGDRRIGAQSWIYQEGQVVEVGPTGSSFRGDDGRRDMFIQGSSKSGEVWGYATRFSGTDELGVNPWLYDAKSNQTVVLERSGARFERADGRQFHQITGRVSDGGAFIGRSFLYQGEDQVGQEAWLWSDGVYRQIGLTGDEYRTPEGFSSTTVGGLTPVTNILYGTTDRYENGAVVARDGWYHDLETGEMHTLRAEDLDGQLGRPSWKAGLSVSRSGTLTGSYDTLAEDGQTVISSGFIFRPDLGFIDLRDLIQDDAWEGTWENLWSGLFVQESDAGIEAVIGMGSLVGQEYAETFNLGAGSWFAIAVPAPSTAVLMCSGAWAAGALRRRVR